MARIELYKVFSAFRKTNELMEKAESNLDMVHEGALESEDYDNKRIMIARAKLKFAIAELQKAKQILTKE